MAHAWGKALRVVSVIAWYAGLVYVFRLFVPHAKYRFARRDHVRSGRAGRVVDEVPTVLLIGIVVAVVVRS